MKTKSLSRVFVIFATFFLLPSPLLFDEAQATETDDTTGWLYFSTMKDSLPLVNAMTNYLFEKARVMANSSGTACSDFEMRKGLWNTVAGNFVGKLEQMMEDSPDIDKYTNNVGTSIYRELDFSQAPVTVTVRLGSAIRMGKYLIGTDKLGHFFAEGNADFRGYFIEGKPLDSIINYGIVTEVGIFGAATTSVYSKADTTANFNGSIFWSQATPQFINDKRMLVKGSPYFECKDGKWEQVRRFNWLDYVDAGFSEKDNCSEYRSKDVLESVYKGVEETMKEYEAKTAKKSPNLHCPVLKDYCAAAAKRYGYYAKYLLHDKCRNAVNE